MTAAYRPKRRIRRKKRRFVGIAKRSPNCEGSAITFHPVAIGPHQLFEYHLQRHCASSPIGVWVPLVCRDDPSVVSANDWLEHDKREVDIGLDWGDVVIFVVNLLTWPPHCVLSRWRRRRRVTLRHWFPQHLPNSLESARIN